MKGELFVLSAPSGAGKTTLVQALLKGDLARVLKLGFAVSHTTREPRSGESNGKDYHFVDEAEFRRMLDRDLFLEWAWVHGCLYGTSLEEVRPRIDSGQDVILDIDVQGAEAVFERGADQLETAVHSVFILPPTLADLETRLRARRQNADDDISRRLAAARDEIRKIELYDYVIVNENAELASLSLAAIILDKRHRRPRMGRTIDAVLQDLGTASTPRVP